MLRKKTCSEVSVVVINARETRHLERCLKFLVQTDYPNFEIIVVDCQTPQIQEWVTERFKDVKVVHYEYDIGPSASHNVGVAEASSTSKYIAFLDNDTVVEPGWLKELIKVVEAEDGRGVAQGKILRMEEEGRLDHTGLAIDALGTWSTTFNMKERNFSSVFEIFAASFAACIVRRDVFNEVGGFDEDYFIYDDDTDFCWRTRLLGSGIVFVPSARARHCGQITKGLSPRRLYHAVKNRTCTMLKNYELKNLWQRICVFYVLTLLSAFTFILLSKREQASALLRGLAYPVLNLKTIWRKRLRVQIRRRVSDKELFQKGLLRRDVYPTVLDVINKVALMIFGEPDARG